MANDTVKLPPGFVLDEVPQGSKIQPLANSAVLPEGFVLDSPVPAQPSRENIIDEQISNRPSAMADLITTPTTIRHPAGAVLRTLSGAAELYQGVPASIALDLQRGRPQDIIPNIGKVVTGQRPVKYGDVFRGAGVPEPLAAAGGLYTDIALAPGGAKGMVNVAKGAKNIVSSGASAIKNIPNRFFRGGLTKKEALRIEQTYGSSTGSLVQVVKDKLNQAIDSANNAYKAAINNFKGNSIRSNQFYQAVQSGLRRKGWIDLKGNPTTRYKNGLNPTYDKLTDLYLDMRNAPTAAGKRISGHVISKEDFSTYRDALGSMLKEKPSDVLIMQSRNALYNSAEKSGMTGIKLARNMERDAFQKAKRFLDSKGDLKIATEAKLSRIGTKRSLSSAEMLHIRGLQDYVKHPIIEDADKINKINNALKRISNIKKYGAGAAGGAIAGAVGRKIATGSF